MDNHHPELDHCLSDFDVDQRFVSSDPYQLPFGRGQKIAWGSNRAADPHIGGWETTGIATTRSASLIASRPPIWWSSGYILPACGPDLGLRHSQHLTKNLQRINLDRFAEPALGVYGNSARNWLRQPGINNWDMGIGKSFRFAKRTVQVHRRLLQCFQPPSICHWHRSSDWQR